MPVYDFKCPNCGVVEEVFTHHTDWTHKECEGCGHAMNRLFGVPAIKMGGHEKQWGLIDQAEMNAKLDRESPGSYEAKALQGDPQAIEAREYCRQEGITL